MANTGVWVTGSLIILVLIGGFFLFNNGNNSSSNNNEGIIVVDKSNIQEEEITLDEETPTEVPEQTQTETIEEVPEQTQTETIEEVPETKEFNIIARQWDFSPSTITVNEGDNVILNIESIDVTHGFVLSSFGVSERLESGKTITVEFIADKKGTFSFFCNVQCGSGHGNMRGTLVVQ